MSPQISKLSDKAFQEPRPIEELPKALHRLVRMALKARKRAYAPYSRFLVGCAIQDARGKVHSGCNVENASYPATICAERTAIVKMVSRGAKDARCIVVTTSSEDPCFPCGVCLQVLAEFGKRAVVVAVNATGTRFRAANLADLYPASFSGEFLKR